MFWPLLLLGILFGAADSRALVGPGVKIAPAGMFPYQIALFFNPTSEPLANKLMLECGGTLIAPTWVLTAAHCLKPAFSSTPGYYYVLTGTTELTSGGQYIGVTKVIRHPAYDRSTFKNDIALLQLEQPVGEQNTIAPLPAEKAALIGPGQTGTVSGWGRTDPNDDRPYGVNDLRYASVQFVNQSACNAPDSYDGRVLDTMTCALGVQHTDACKFDSGGPLTVSDQGTNYVAGIVSWGKGCGQAQDFGVYTSVPVFADWIRQQMATPLAN